MVLFNYATKELTAKIVYYGPGLCGKTTNLQYIYKNLPAEARGKMLSLATKTDRTLFFDFLPIDLGSIRGMRTRVQLYTVPGQVFYNETRKLVLKGADGIVFVADSQKDMLQANIESFRNLEENLRAHGMNLAEMPHVLQFNKRDLPRLATVEELNTALNKYNAPFYESVATTGIGVQDTLKAICRLVLLHLSQKYEGAGARPAARAPEPARAASPAPPPAAAGGTSQAGPPPPAAATATQAGPPPPRPNPQPAPQAAPARAAAAAATVELETEPPPAAPRFDDDEIEAWVEEVETSAHAPEPAETAPPAPAAEGPGEPERPLALEQKARGADLFADPALEVARVAPGRPQEILVPVEIGDGAARRRYTLSVRLVIEPADD